MNENKNKREILLSQQTQSRPAVYWNGDVMRFIVSNYDNPDYSGPSVDIPSDPPCWSTLQMVITDRCNAKCKYCQVRENALAPENKDMSLETAEVSLTAFQSSLQTANDIARATIILTGGETSLVPQTVRFVLNWVDQQFSPDCRPRIIINTNAMAWTDDMTADVAASTDWTYVIVSIDGDEVSHDKYRPTHDGQGSFAVAAAGIDELKRAGIKYGITAVVTGENIDKMPQSAEFICNRFAPASLGFNLVHRRSGSDPDLQKADPAIYAKKLLETDQVARSFGISVEQANRFWKPLLTGAPRIRDCQAGQTTIAVLPEGIYVPCYTQPRLHDQQWPPVSPEITISDDDVFCKWQQRTSLTIKKCQGCQFHTICGGGCPLDAELATGQLMGVDPRVCVVTKTMMTGIGSMLAQRYEGFEGCKVVTPIELSEVARGGLPGENQLWRSVNH